MSSTKLPRFVLFLLFLLPGTTACVMTLNAKKITSATLFSKISNYTGCTLSNVTTMQLDNNQITVIPPGVFDRSTALEFLYLQNNKIPAIPSDAFKYNTKLQLIYLQSNNFQDIPSDAFTYNTALNTLSLSTPPSCNNPEDDAGVGQCLRVNSLNNPNNGYVVAPSSTSPSGAVESTGPVVGGVVGVLLIAVLGFFFFKRSSNKKVAVHTNKLVGSMEESTDNSQSFSPYMTKKSLRFRDLALQKPPIASGNFGHVYRAVWHSTEVAVKILKNLSETEVEGESAVADFEKELQLNERLPPHKNCVPYSGAVIEPPNLCLVMSLMAGDTKRLVVDDKTKFADKGDFSKILQIGVDASAGITHLHHERIIHRDIAARNVLLDCNNTAYICDYGLSLNLEEGKKYGTSPGGSVPVPWMSPEALSRREYSEKSDVYMFGVFLWELFARASPFLPFDDITKLGKEIAESNRHPDIPDAWPPVLKELLLDCWESNPDNRPTMGGVNSKLQRIVKTAMNEGLELPCFVETTSDLEAALYSTEGSMPDTAFLATMTSSNCEYGSSVP